MATVCNVYGLSGEGVLKTGFYYEPVTENQNCATPPVSSFNTICEMVCETRGEVHV